MVAAWGKFHSLCPISGKRDGNLHKRLRLFDTSVTQTALWCSESWLLTQSEKRLLCTTQHAMLRRIAGPRRAPEEPWVDWTKQSTKRAVAAAKESGIKLWLQAHLKNKWCWAGHVLRMTPGRLARRAVEWRDCSWQATEYQLPVQLRTRRPCRKRWFRWEDDLRNSANRNGWTFWQEVAEQRFRWRSHCEGFVEYGKK